MMLSLYTSLGLCLILFFVNTIAALSSCFFVLYFTNHPSFFFFVLNNERFRVIMFICEGKGKKFLFSVSSMQGMG